ncbi:4Fe-4S dicluster domain-containing protein, partial [Candidatus Dependentiae bacterium]|nr:4Fe-4S dicluster domain-containing protein [Candidatus Dependentiae bacterium]
NTCTKACPMDIEVMQYIAEIIKGDYKKAAELSHSCIMCGMCAARCPAELQQFNVAMFIRRMYGRYVLPKAEHLKNRVEDIEAGKYEPMLDELQQVSSGELVKRYKEREWEPEPYEVPDWKPKDTKYL